MNQNLVRAIALVTFASLASNTGSSLSMVVGIRPSQERALIVNGKTYVPLSALGVSSSLSGTTLTFGSG